MPPSGGSSTSKYGREFNGATTRVVNMPSTRRRLLTGTGAVVTMLSGCANFGPSAPHIAKLEVRLENRTVEDKTFHFAVETADGLREWVSQDVIADTSETIVREPSETFEPVAIHGVVDKQTARGDFSAVAKPRSAASVFVSLSDVARTKTQHSCKTQISVVEGATEQYRSRSPNRYIGTADGDDVS